MLLACWSRLTCTQSSSDTHILITHVYTHTYIAGLYLMVDIALRAGFTTGSSKECLVADCRQAKSLLAACLSKRLISWDVLVLWQCWQSQECTLYPWFSLSTLSVQSCSKVHVPLAKLCSSAIDCLLRTSCMSASLLLCTPALATFSA